MSTMFSKTLKKLRAESDEFPNVIIVDDTKIILKGGIPVLEAVMPNAVITGFTRPSEAVEYAKINLIALAFLDIELGKTNGLELCRTLLEINPRTIIMTKRCCRDRKNTNTTLGSA